MVARRGGDQPGAFGASVAGRLGGDGAQHPLSVGEGAQVALAVDPAKFEAGHLGDRQARLGDANRDEGLDLEAVAPDAAAVGGLGQVRVW